MTRKLEDVVANRRLVSATATQSAMDAARLMAAHNVGSVVILDGKRLEGIVTERDIITKVLAKGRHAEETPIAEIMTRNPVAMPPDKPFVDALVEMADRGFRHIPVVDRFGVLGVVSIRDAIGTEHAAMDRMIQAFDAIDRKARAAWY